MSAGIIIGILAFLGFLAFIVYSIYNIESDTDCNSSGCTSPGGNWLKDKCTCSCNPGYGGVNCQTKSKNVTDLETTCKDKTGKPCVDCLKGWITKKLSGNPSDVQDFKNDFYKDLISINNFCCQKNCSNASATVCDKCVSDGMQQLPHIKDDTAYFINNKGCLSSKITNQPQNFIGKTSICNIQNPTPCIPNPCKNNSTCTVIDQNNFKCTCPPGPPFFDGSTCSKSCRKKTSTSDCDDIKGEINCQYYYNNDKDNRKCEKSVLFGDCSNSYDGVASDKCT